MKRRLTHNMGLKLVSVLVACLIWLVVMDSNDQERTQAFRNVPITIKNEDTITNANKTYTVVDDVDKVTVYVTARRTVRSRLTAANFSVRADLENYNEALGAVPLEFSCTDSSVTVENMRIVPSSLKIKMEDKIEQSFAVATTSNVKAQKGYELGRTTLLSGDTIKIAGPESLINIIGRVTVPLDDIASLTENKVGQYPVKIEDKNGAAFTESQMSKLELKSADGVVLQDNMVEVGIEIWKIYEDIPVRVQLSGDLAEGYRVTNVALTPSTVNLAASEEGIQEIGDALILDDEISINGVFDNREYTVDINDTLSKYTNVRLQAETASVVTVNLQVEQVGSRTLDLPVSELEIQNAPEGKKLIFSPTDKLQINVRATEENLDKLTVDHIKASLDLTECTENGSYNIPVQVTLPEDYELGAQVTIVVNVGDMEDEETEAEAEAFTGE